MAISAPPEISLQPNVWFFESVLHKGKISEITLLVNDFNDERVVMKRNIGRLCEERYSNEFKLAALQTLRGNENVISFLGTFDDCILMEFASDGNLKDLIATKPDFWSVYSQIASGLRFIHQNQIAHRDLKLQNILVTDRAIFKISDFNLSKRFIDDAGKRVRFTESIGTPRYQSPELLRDREYDGESSDIWAFGIVLLQLLTTEGIWSRAHHSDEIYQRFLNNSFPTDISDEERSFLANFLQTDPEKRHLLPK